MADGRGCCVCICVCVTARWLSGLPPLGPAAVAAVCRDKEGLTGGGSGVAVPPVCGVLRAREECGCGGRGEGRRGREKREAGPRRAGEAKTRGSSGSGSWSAHLDRSPWTPSPTLSRCRPRWKVGRRLLKSEGRRLCGSSLVHEACAAAASASGDVGLWRRPDRDQHPRKEGRPSLDTARAGWDAAWERGHFARDLSCTRGRAGPVNCSAPLIPALPDHKGPCMCGTGWAPLQLPGPPPALAHS